MEAGHSFPLLSSVSSACDIEQVSGLGITWESWAGGGGGVACWENQLKTAGSRQWSPHHHSSFPPGLSLSLSYQMVDYCVPESLFCTWFSKRINMPKHSTKIKTKSNHMETSTKVRKAVKCGTNAAPPTKNIPSYKHTKAACDGTTLNLLQWIKKQWYKAKPIEILEKMTDTLITIMHMSLSYQYLFQQIKESELKHQLDNCNSNAFIISICLWAHRGICRVSNHSIINLRLIGRNKLMWCSIHKTVQICTCHR